ncbi:DUF4231 domain-containing protein [Streptomyces sp. XH2]|uniref:DUF4231 domain-containing protein n=1 Tax=Streptomyces sp. XH2 TaxID=3412483 RepID=UPI003C7A191F
MWLLSSLATTAFLGWTMVLGAWQSSRGAVSVVGGAMALVSTSLASWQLLQMRPKFTQQRYQISELHAKRVALAAKEALNPIDALRVYRVQAVEDIERYRDGARRNRRYSNILQWMVIVGSVAATSLTSLATESSGNLAAKVAPVISALVSIAAGLTAYFKFRERGFNEQQTADAIEKEYKGVELRIGDYSGGGEQDVLARFAQRVESLKDEQRKRELQLEQSSGERERGAGGAS